MIDISRLKAINVANSIGDIQKLDLNGLAENLNHILKHKTRKADREKVYQILRKLEEFSPLSYEWIMYLLETSSGVSHAYAIGSVGSNLTRLRTRPMMRKVKAILKEYHHLKVIPVNKYCKTITNLKGSLTSTNTKKVYHFLELGCLK